MSRKKYKNRPDKNSNASALRDRSEAGIDIMSESAASKATDSEFNDSEAVVSDVNKSGTATIDSGKNSESDISYGGFIADYDYGTGSNPGEHNENSRLRLITLRLSTLFCCAAVLAVLFGLLYYSEAERRLSYAESVAGSALSELTDRVNELYFLLDEAASGSGRSLTQLSADIGNASGAASAQLSRLTVNEESRRRIGFFLDMCRNMVNNAPELSVGEIISDGNTSGGSGTEGDVRLSALAEYAGRLGRSLASMRENTDRGISVTEATLSFAAELPPGSLEADDEGGAENTDGTSTMQPPHNALPPQAMISASYARRKALRYFGSTLSLKITEINQDYYRFTCENGFADIVRSDGRLLRFAVCKTVGDPKLSIGEALTSIYEFLENEGYTDFHVLSHRTDGGILRAKLCKTISTYYGDALALPYCVTAGVSLDSGLICLYDASSYPNTALPQISRRQMISPEEAAEKSGCSGQARLICRYFGGSAMLVYEFTGESKNTLTYVSACTQKSDGGTVRAGVVLESEYCPPEIK